jgi:hypothetical protein
MYVSILQKLGIFKKMHNALLTKEIEIYHNHRNCLEKLSLKITQLAKFRPSGHTGTRLQCRCFPPIDLRHFEGYSKKCHSNLHFKASMNRSANCCLRNLIDGVKFPSITISVCQATAPPFFSTMCFCHVLHLNRHTHIFFIFYGPPKAPRCRRLGL